MSGWPAWQLWPRYANATLALCSIACFQRAPSPWRRNVLTIAFCWWAFQVLSLLCTQYALLRGWWDGGGGSGGGVAVSSKDEWGLGAVWMFAAWLYCHLYASVWQLRLSKLECSQSNAPVAWAWLFDGGFALLVTALGGACLSYWDTPQARFLLVYLGDASLCGWCLLQQCLGRFVAPRRTLVLWVWNIGEAAAGCWALLGQPGAPAGAWLSLGLHVGSDFLTGWIGGSLRPAGNAFILLESGPAGGEEEEEVEEEEDYHAGEDRENEEEQGPKEASALSCSQALLAKRALRWAALLQDKLEELVQGSALGRLGALNPLSLVGVVELANGEEAVAEAQLQHALSLLPYLRGPRAAGDRLPPGLIRSSGTTAQDRDLALLLCRDFKSLSGGGSWLRQELSARWCKLQVAWDEDTLATPLNILCPPSTSRLCMLEVWLAMLLDELLGDPRRENTLQRRRLLAELTPVLTRPLDQGGREEAAEWLCPPWQTPPSLYLQLLEHSAHRLLLGALFALHREAQQQADLVGSQAGHGGWWSHTTLQTLACQLRLDRWASPRLREPKPYARALLWLLLPGVDSIPYSVSRSEELEATRLLHAQHQLEQCLQAASCLHTFVLLSPRDLARPPHLSCAAAWAWLDNAQVLQQVLTKNLKSANGEPHQLLELLTHYCQTEHQAPGALALPNLCRLLRGHSQTTSCLVLLALLGGLPTHSPELARRLAGTRVVVAAVAGAHPQGPAATTKQVRLSVLLALLLRMLLRGRAVSDALPASERQRANEAHTAPPDPTPTARRRRPHPAAPADGGGALWVSENDPLLSVLLTLLVAIALVLLSPGLRGRDPGGQRRFEGVLGALLGNLHAPAWLGAWLRAVYDSGTDQQATYEAWHDDVKCPLHSYAETLMIRRRDSGAAAKDASSGAHIQRELKLMSSLHGNLSLQRLLPSLCEGSAGVQLGGRQTSTVGVLLPYLLNSMGADAFGSFVQSLHLIMERAHDEFDDWVTIMIENAAFPQWKIHIELAIAEITDLPFEIDDLGGLAAMTTTTQLLHSARPARSALY